MGCGCKKKQEVPQPTPEPLSIVMNNPQTPEQYLAQELNKWNGGVQINEVKQSEDE